MLTVLVGLVLMLPISLSAQWFRVRTPGVPRLASGAPNLKAPAPRSADGKPDLSGIWIADNPLPCPPNLRDGNDCIEKIALSRQAANIAMDLPGGLPYQPWAAALAKQRAADLGKDDPHVRCPDISRATNILGWKPEIGVDEGLRLTIDYFRKLAAA